MVTWIDSELIAVIRRTHKLEKFATISELIDEIAEKQALEGADSIAAELKYLEGQFSELEQSLNQLREEVYKEKEEELTQLNQIVLIGEDVYGESDDGKYDNQVKKERIRLENGLGALKRSKMETIQVLNPTNSSDKLEVFRNMLAALKNRVVVYLMEDDQKEAIRAIFENDNHQRPVFSLLNKKVHSEADKQDIYTDSVFKLVDKIREGEEVRTIGGFLYTIVTYRELNFFRDGRRLEKNQINYLETTCKNYPLSEAAKMSVDKKIQYQLLAEEISKMKGLFRSVLVYKMQDYTWDEIVAEIYTEEELEEKKKEGKDPKKMLGVYYANARKKLKKTIKDSPYLREIFEDFIPKEKSVPAEVS